MLISRVIFLSNAIPYSNKNVVKERRELKSPYPRKDGHHPLP
jgi:hypothetical protein